MPPAALATKDIDDAVEIRQAAKKSTVKAALAPATRPDSNLDKLEEDFLTRVGKAPKPGEEPEGVIGTFKRWSSSAVECYLRDAECTGCYYSGFFKDKQYDCKMYLAVAQLLETHGKPTRNMIAKHS